MHLSDNDTLSPLGTKFCTWHSVQRAKENKKPFTPDSFSPLRKGEAWDEKNFPLPQQKLKM